MSRGCGAGQTAVVAVGCGGMGGGEQGSVVQGVATAVWEPKQAVSGNNKSKMRR